VLVFVTIFVRGEVIVAVLGRGSRRDVTTGSEATDEEAGRASGLTRSGATVGTDPAEIATGLVAVFRRET